MHHYRIVEEVTRRPKAMTGVLKKMMIFFAVIFVLMGIAVSRGLMLPGVLLAALYYFYDLFSQKAYEYTLEDNHFTIDMILGRRYRRTVHELDLNELEAVAPNRHERVAAYRKRGGSVRLPKYDYTSYEPDIPYYTMIVAEDKQKIKLLLDLNEEMLGAMKRRYPDRVFL